jgi:acetyl-CoA carboxylase carboxyltransferase component
MSWQPELDEIARRRAIAAGHGGPDKVAKHRAQGRQPVRERIAQLLDPGSFDEVGSVSGFPEYDEAGRLVSFVPANLVCGRGTVEGRPVFVTGDDFTVRGGANDGGVRDKFAYAETHASRWRVPLVRLVDGTGGGGSVKHLETSRCSPRCSTRCPRCRSSRSGSARSPAWVRRASARATTR